jgi:serine/threonine kinase 38
MATLQPHSATPYKGLKLQALKAHTSMQVEHVKAERNVLAEVHNPYIVKLYYSFQDEEFLYLVMEYLPGGDVMVSHA